MELGNETRCELTDDVVSYLYKELGDDRSEALESHLLTCTNCTDEFAALSNARFSVFEWRKEEFAHIPTPQIVIPWRQMSVQESSRGWGIFAALDAIMSGLRSPVMAAAAVFAVLGLAFAAFVIFRPGDVTLSANSEPIPAPAYAAPAPPAKQETTTAGDTASVSKPIERAVKVSVRSEVPRRHAEATRQPIARERRKPVLSEMSDAEDKSLRLADLLDDIGG